MKKVISLSCLAMALFIVSCKKDGDDDGKTKMELITSAAWKYDYAMVDQDKDEDGDFPLPDGIVDECESDNIVTLDTDGTGTVDEGATKCDAGDPQTLDIDWEFTNNETTINLPSTVFGPISGEAKILVLTSTKLRLLKHVTDPIDANIIVDLKH